MVSGSWFMAQGAGHGVGGRGAAAPGPRPGSLSHEPPLLRSRSKYVLPDALSQLHFNKDCSGPAFGHDTDQTCATTFDEAVNEATRIHKSTDPW